MTTRDEQQAKLLYEYAAALRDDPDQPPAIALAPELAATTRRAAAALHVPPLSADFVALLQQRLEGEVAATNPPADQPAPLLQPRRSVPSRASGWLAAAGLIVLLVAGGLWFATSVPPRGGVKPQAQAEPATPTAVPTLPPLPEPQTAAEVISRANTIPTSGRLRSFHLQRSVVQYERGAGSPYVTASSNIQNADQREVWYEYPQRWRVETRDLREESGQLQAEPVRSVQVSDGRREWGYDAYMNSVGVKPLVFGTLAAEQIPNDNKWQYLNGRGYEVKGYQQIGRSLEAYLSWGLYLTNDATTYYLTPLLCYNAELAAKDMVAGRTTYVVSLRWFDSGYCSKDREGEVSERKLWLDAETYLLLKDESYDAAGKLLRRLAVSSVEYNLPLAASLFDYEPPLGSLLLDFRSSTSGKVEQLRPVTVVNKFRFPVFLPTTMPEDLHPQPLAFGSNAHRQGERIKIRYMSDAGWTDIGNQMRGSMQTQPPPDPPSIYVGLEAVPEGGFDAAANDARPLDIPGLKAWFRPDQTNNRRTRLLGNNGSVLTVEREGVLISISSYEYGQAELVQVAQSLERVADPVAADLLLTPTVTALPLPTEVPTAEPAVPTGK